MGVLMAGARVEKMGMTRTEELMLAPDRSIADVSPSTCAVRMMVSIA